MNDADGPRTEPGQIGSGAARPSSVARRGRGLGDVGVSASILRDAGMVAATAIAERPVAWTLIAGGLALDVSDRSRILPFVCPSGWIVAAVLVTAIAFTAVVRERRGLPAMLAVLAVFAAIVGKGEVPTTPMTVAGAGAIAATLLLHGSPRVLRIAGSVALALGCTFALWRAGWRVGLGVTATLPLETFRLAGLRQEVVIAAGLAMLTPVVRPHVAAGVVIGAALVISIDYIAALAWPVVHVVDALLICGTVAWCAAAVRMSRAASGDGALAAGRFAARLQRSAWVAALLAGCIVIDDDVWSSVLYSSAMFGDDGSTPTDRDGMGLAWLPAVAGIGAACLGALSARLRPRGALPRCVAAFAVASVTVAACEWTMPGLRGDPIESMLFSIRSALWSAPVFVLAAVLALHAPTWPRSTMIAGIAVATLGAVVHAVRVGLTDSWTAQWSGPWFDYLAVFIWGAIAVLAASLPLRAAAVAAFFVVPVVITELVASSVLAVASDGDIPFAPKWGDMARAGAYSLCWVLILRPLCARTPVPEAHPIHRDFDVLSRET